MSKLIMLVGSPMSGKSYSIQDIIRIFNDDDFNNTDIVSSDYYIEEIANILDMTYDEVWNDVKNLAEKAMYKQVNRLISNAAFYNLFLIWDQTNLTVKTRAKKLSLIPSDWTKIAITYPLPDTNESELRKQRRKKEGKHIPNEVLDNMLKNREEVTLSEGFDQIYEYQSETNNFKLIHV